MKDLIKRAEKKKYTALKIRFDLVLDIFRELSKRDKTKAQDLDTLSTSVLELEAKVVSQSQVEQDLRAHINTTSEEIKERLDSLPTYRDLEHIIKNSQLTILPVPPATATQDEAAPTTATTTEKPRHTSTPQKPRSPSPGIDRIHKRIIIIRRATKKQSIKEIQPTLTQFKAC